MRGWFVSCAVEVMCRRIKQVDQEEWENQGCVIYVEKEGISKGRDGGGYRIKGDGGGRWIVGVETDGERKKNRPTKVAESPVHLRYG